jgi:hypothetical protein
MRFFLCVTACVLAVNLVLPARLSAGDGPAIRGGPQRTPIAHQASAVQITLLHKAKKCPPPWYACVYMTPDSSGPYVKFSACSGSQCMSQYDLVPTDSIISIKSGTATKRLRSKWSPNPGNPTSQRITEVKTQKPSKGVKFVDSVSVWFYNYPSSCTASYEIGLIPQ